MMTPDTRPIGVLTPAILATASHWCLHGNGIADTRPSVLLTIPVNENPGLDADPPLLEFEGEHYWPTGNWQCYPCTLQPNGMVVPEPWPVMDGEEEIEEWEGMAPDANIFREPWSPMWCSTVAGQLGESLVAKPGMHPAPRKGGRWVWEKDRC